MIEPPLGLFQIEMKILLGYTTVLIEPMLGIRPEPFDAVDVISSLRSAFFFSNDHMIAPDIQEGIGVPIIGVIQAAWLGVSSHQGHQLLFAPTGNGEG